jgi:phosphoesterase RecJ-like protein
LLRAESVPFSPEISQCVLTGAITDTGAFSNAATTKESLDLASHLLEGGAKLSTVLEHNFRNKKISTLKLWGKILGNLKETADGSVIAVISQADLVGAGNEDEGTEGLANFLQTLRDAKMIVVIKELPDGQLKGSLRTTRDDVDVSAIAKSYGGGGHKKAAGFTTKGELIIDEKSWRIE